MSHRSKLTLSALLVALISAWTFKPSTAQDRPAPSAYTTSIDRVMSNIVAGRIDEALAAIDFLKEQPDARAVLRQRLVTTANEQVHCYGYEITAVQSYSKHLHTVWVLGYYEQQPMLFRFEFYRPQAREDKPWVIQGLSLYPNVTEELKETPVDYIGERAASHDR